MPILRGVVGSHPTPSHMIRKLTVNSALAMGHQADPAHCKKCPTFHTTVVHKNTLYIIILTWEDDSSQD
jgi:hypothetical protein